MKAPIKQLPTFVNRTYRGGKLLKEFLNIQPTDDSFTPEDWISSFVAAKNRIPIPNEGITRVLSENGEDLITNVISVNDFGKGRSTSGVLIKLLDAAERLGIQVHPTKEFAMEVFGSPFGKTECWHIIDTRKIDGNTPCIYLGFKEHVTKELWKQLFESQNIDGMLNSMHRFEVKKGDTVLVTAGTPHAIGAGCFMLEIQEPTDYTMRVEKITVAGEHLTPMQIHYGIGEEKMLDCFDYTPKTREQTKKAYFLSQGNTYGALVDYCDTPCFALSKADSGEHIINSPDCVTAVFLDDGGEIEYGNIRQSAERGDKFFIPANTKTIIRGAETLLCEPPKN